MPLKNAPRAHTWRFFRSGGLDQVRLDRGSDIASLRTLDFKLWVALSCPVQGLELDERTLAWIDADRDGRVRANEVLAAIDWSLARLKAADSLANGGPLPLAAISGDGIGKPLLAAASRVFAVLGRPAAEVLSVDDCVAAAREVAKLPRNGDGVVPPQTIASEKARALATRVVGYGGGVADRSGVAGVSRASLAAFFDDARAALAWHEEAEVKGSAVLPLGAATGAAFDALEAMRAKVDDWFARAAVAAFDDRALAAVNRREEEYLAVAAADLSVDARELADFPLARVVAAGELPLVDGLNPAWAAAVAALRDRVLAPVLGGAEASLAADRWREVVARFEAHRAWRARRPATVLAALPVADLREAVGAEADAARAEIERAIGEDEAVGVDLAALDDLERLARFHRDLRRLLENFVSFSDFYSRRDAIFQVGTLYLDGRGCRLCLRVDSADGHATLALLARTFIAYCDCVRKATGEKMTIAAAFTAGDSDHLIVGRNGVFVDKRGRDWDATIVKILDHPISIREAFFAPYKRVIRFVEEMATKRATAADTLADGRLASAASKLEQSAAGAPPPAKPKFDVGVVAALGVAFGGITTALGLVMGAFFGLGWKMPFGLLGVVLLISLPSMLIAWLKLRQRNIGPVLDACGWAVNGRVKVNVALGRALTDERTLPAGSERSLRDPYAPKKPWWPWFLLVLLVAVATVYVLYRVGVFAVHFPRVHDAIEFLLKVDRE